MKFSVPLKRHFSLRPGIIASGVIVVLLAAGAVALAAHQAGHKQTRAATGAKTRSAQIAAPNSATGAGSAKSPASAGNTADADTQAAAAGASVPITEACKLLTLAVAKQLLGNNAAADTPGDTSSLQAADTSLSACAYRSGSSTVQLVTRTPTSPLGKSENATVFGSGKPSDAVDVSGYGQSAYWDPGKGMLNVLGNNNWYAITRRPDGTRADAEAVAASLKPGF